MSWKLTRSGRAFDLVNPRAADVDIEVDVAIPLSLIKRFDGHAGDTMQGFSVAQHCCIGADWLMVETARPALALAFLLHDAHEAYIGDQATPVVLALDEIGQQEFGQRRHRVGDIVKLAKFRLDAAIHERLGLGWPLPPEIAEAVADMDVRMLRTERDQLMPATPRPWPPSVERAKPLPIALTCWPAEIAAREWLARLYLWHPGYRP